MAAMVSPHRLRLAAHLLRHGGVIVHATEGVWGLSAHAHDRQAVQRILELKQRDIRRGLIVVAADAKQLAPLVASGHETAWQKARSTWPAAITWLLPAADTAPYWLTGGQPTIALRQTPHALTRALCRILGGPIVSTSANISGRPPVASSWRARASFGARIDLVLGGQPDNPGRSSTICHAITGETIRV